MGRAQRIIDLVMGDARLAGSRALSEKVYRDEPILITASQMRQFMPRKYREMRSIATSPEARYKPLSWTFAQQARFMEDFEDDYPFQEGFVQYYPTYQSMSDEQLRGYFSWRSRMRKGEALQAPTSFVFIYIYELLNGVGASSPEEGFGKLRDVLDGYGKADSAIRRYLGRWMIDYAAWYNVPAQALAGFVGGGVEESIAAIDAAAHAHVPQDELFGALANLSTYRVESSRLYKEHPAELRRALCGTCTALARYCEKHRKTTFAEGLFGEFRMLPHQMFSNAVFYDDGHHPDAAYALADGRRYICRNGTWGLMRRIPSNRGPKLGAIVKAVDARVREELGMGSPLKMPALPKYMQSIVAAEAHAAVEWERAHKPFELHLDAARLSGIRTAASQTCEALLVDEERDAGDVSAAPVAPASRAQGVPQGAHGVEGVGVRRATPPSSASSGDYACAQVPIPWNACIEEAGSGAADAASAAGGSTPPARPSADVSADDANDSAVSLPLGSNEAAWLRALLAGDAAAATRAVVAAGTSGDLMMDAVNDALFDLLGDVAVELDGDSPAIVEDYREDLEGLFR